MVAVIETIGVMMIARTETASRSDAGYERAMRFNALVNLLEPVIYAYYEENGYKPKIPTL